MQMYTDDDAVSKNSDIDGTSQIIILDIKVNVLAGDLYVFT